MAKTTITLADHQRAVLTMAAYSTNLLAWPLPKRLKLSKGSTTIVVKGLLRKGLVEERPAFGNDPIWREREDGKARERHTDWRWWVPIVASFAGSLIAVLLGITFGR